MVLLLDATFVTGRAFPRNPQDECKANALLRDNSASLF
jgi:hypothetical protein